MGFAQFVRAVRRGWWIVLATFVVCVAIGAGFAYGTTPQYQATVTFYVSIPTRVGDNLLNADQAAQARTASYAALMTTDMEAAAIVAADPTIGLSQRDITGRITTTAATGSVLLQADVTDTSSARALKISQAISSTFPVLVANVDKASRGNASVLTRVSGPKLHQGAVSPHKKVLLGISAIAGLVLGLVIVFVRELFRLAPDEPRSAPPAVVTPSDGAHRRSGHAPSPTSHATTDAPGATGDAIGSPVGVYGSQTAEAQH